jgi:hypothetical protein
MMNLCHNQMLDREQSLQEVPEIREIREETRGCVLLRSFICGDYKPLDPGPFNQIQNTHHVAI